MEGIGIDDMDGQQVADALVSTQTALVDAEARVFELVAQWAVIHDAASITGTGSGRVLPGTERAKRYGGLGTPRVAEFAHAELGVLLGKSPVAAGHLLADVLDLRYRHPALWSAVTARRVRTWQAVTVARATRAADLTLEQAHWVDTEVVDYLGALPWTAFTDLVAAKIIEADPDAAEARAQAAAMRQFVATGRHTEYGLKTLVARAEAGDVIFFVAMVDRIANILGLDGDPRPLDLRRAAAIGILANPARALTLLQCHAAPNGTRQEGGDDAPVTRNDDGAERTRTSDGSRADGADRAHHHDDADVQQASEPDEGPAAEPHASRSDPAAECPAGSELDGVLDLFGDRHIDTEHEPHTDPCAPRPGQARWPEEPPADHDHDDHRLAAAAEADRGSRLAATADDALICADPADAAPDAPRAGAPPGDPPDPDALRPGDLHPVHDDNDEPPTDRSAGSARRGPDAGASLGLRPVPHRCPTCNGNGTVPGDPARYVDPAPVDPAKLLPAATLYVHVAADALSTGRGVARIEDGVGPVTVGQAVRFLRHCHVTVKEVIDLTALTPVDSYETPTRMREAIRLLRPRSVFPYSGSTSRSMDLDHPNPYRPMHHGGPADQTDPYKLAPLSRYEHRVKTHARGWRMVNPRPGVYLWRTPHGHWTRVDPHGTRPLGRPEPATPAEQQLHDLNAAR